MAKKNPGVRECVNGIMDEKNRIKRERRVKKVNKLIKKVFGRRFRGDFNFDEGYNLVKTDKLHLLVRRKGIFLGDYEAVGVIEDYGGHLRIEVDSLYKTNAERYSRAHNKKFGEEVEVESRVGLTSLLAGT